MRWWGGLRTIGGNIVSLEYQDSRLIFDFGFIPHPNSEILGEKVKTRTSRFVHDYVSLEVAPAIDGIEPSYVLTGKSSPRFTIGSRRWEKDSCSCFPFTFRSYWFHGDALTTDSHFFNGGFVPSVSGIGSDWGGSSWLSAEFTSVYI